MVRDEELNRLIRYAQGMGLSVNFKPDNNGINTAEWATDGSQIIIYTSPGDSKLDKILNLIHELGHHKGFIQNGRKIDRKVEEALEDEEKKKNRKILYFDEIEDTKHWEQIYKDTDCKFDIKKLHKRKELDIWVYEVYYETGNLPSRKMTRKKLAQLREKYGC